jgi:hypothetical protein
MSQDSSNFYPKPNSVDLPQSMPPGGGLSGVYLVQQRVVAILLIVHGGMLLVMGFMLAMSAAVMPSIIAANAKNQLGPPPSSTSITLLMITYGLMAAAGVIPGGLQIYAGIENLYLRGYVLGIVALGTGMVALGTCYCMPTATALLIYGLIIYTNDSVRRAFEMAKNGHNYDDILRMVIAKRY